MPIISGQADGGKGLSITRFVTAENFIGSRNIPICMYPKPLAICGLGTMNIRTWDNEKSWSYFFVFKNKG